jgi:hypothetical protein
MKGNDKCGNAKNESIQVCDNLCHITQKVSVWGSSDDNNNGAYEH